MRCGPTRGVGGECGQDMGTGGVLGHRELQPTQEAKAPPGGAWRKQTGVMSAEVTREKEARPSAGQVKRLLVGMRARAHSCQGWADSLPTLPWPGTLESGVHRGPTGTLETPSKVGPGLALHGRRVRSLFLAAKSPFSPTCVPQAAAPARPLAFPCWVGGHSGKPSADTWTGMAVPCAGRHP